MTYLTEVGVGIHFRTTMRTRSLVDWLTALRTEKGFRVIDSTTKRAFLTCYLLLLHLQLLHCNCLILHAHLLLQFLWPDSALRCFIGYIVVVYHDGFSNN